LLLESQQAFPVGDDVKGKEKKRYLLRVVGKVRSQSSFLTCVSGCAHHHGMDARESLLSKAVAWVLPSKGHVILGGDLNIRSYRLLAP